MQLEADGVGSEGSASQPRAFDRTLAFSDPILRRTALVVEGDDALGGPRQVGYDEAYARAKLTRMPLDLGHDAAQLSPALRLIGEPGVVTTYASGPRRSPFDPPQGAEF